MSSTSSISSTSPTSSSGLDSTSSMICQKDKNIAENIINALTNELIDKIDKINKLKQKTPPPSQKLMKAYNNKCKEIVLRIRDLVKQYNLLQGKEVRQFCYQIANANDDDKKDENIR